MRLPDWRCEQIKRIVVNTFVDFDIKCIPISGFEMATKLDAAIIPYSSLPIEKRILIICINEDGFSVYRNGKWYIYYNDSKSYGRINNTLMHECAHIILDHKEHSQLAEAEAKFFAKYALAPPPLIQKMGKFDASFISEQFDISFEAACYALDYYDKWLRYGDRSYTDYEIRLLQQFNYAM